MIFVYPAAISGNVDKRYLPGIIKTMELYYLHHIAEAAASNQIRFYATQNQLTGQFSDIKMEAIDWDFETLGNPSTLVESSFRTLAEAIDDDIRAAETALDNAKIKSDSAYKDYQQQLTNLQYNTDPGKNNELRAAVERDKAEYQRAKSDYDMIQRRVDQLRSERDKRIYGSATDTSKQASQIAARKAEKDYEAELRKPASGGLGDLRLDTSGIMDLRPTSITVSANVTYYKKDRFQLSPMAKRIDVETRYIPIGVKVVPINIGNIGDIYQTMSKDLSANAYSAFYRRSIRGLGKALFKWFTPAVRTFMRLFVKPEEFNVWRDMIFTSKNIINASSLGGGDRSPGYQKYASAILVMSINDLEGKDANFFNDPSKVAKLQKLGWNSFAIMNDPDQVMTFCSYFENGMCTQISYNYLFHSLKASDLFKELDSLGRFTNRIVGNFKRKKIKVAEQIDLRLQHEKRLHKLEDEFTEIANGPNRRDDK